MIDNLSVYFVMFIYIFVKILTIIFIDPNNVYNNLYNTIYCNNKRVYRFVELLSVSSRKNKTKGHTLYIIRSSH